MPSSLSHRKRDSDTVFRGGSTHWKGMCGDDGHWRSASVMVHNCVQYLCSTRDYSGQLCCQRTETVSADST